MNTEQERRDFESAYAAAWPYSSALPGKFDRDGQDDYADGTVHVGWNMWQAAIEHDRQMRGEPIGWIRAEHADWLHRGIRIGGARISPRQDDEPVKPPPDLVVTKNGIPLEDQNEAIRQFKQACMDAADREEKQAAVAAELGKVPSDTQPLIDMIETLCNGLEWNIENHPTIMNESDAEALEEARALLARYGQPAASAETDVDDERHPRFIAGYQTGLKDAKLSTMSAAKPAASAEPVEDDAAYPYLPDGWIIETSEQYGTFRAEGPRERGDWMPTRQAAIAQAWARYADDLRRAAIAAQPQVALQAIIDFIDTCTIQIVDDDPNGLVERTRESILRSLTELVSTQPAASAERKCPRCGEPAVQLFTFTDHGEEIGTTHCGCLHGAALAPQPDMHDAYVGAREDLEDWKRRALKAEAQLREQPAASAEHASQALQPVAQEPYAYIRTIDAGNGTVQVNLIAADIVGDLSQYTDIVSFEPLFRLAAAPTPPAAGYANPSTSGL